MAKYCDEIVKKITELITSDSYTVSELCNIVGISRGTFFLWQKEKPDFFDAIKKAEEERKEYFVIEAKKSLLKKIQGYKSEEERITYIGDKNGNAIIKEKVVTKKDIAPDTAAIIFTLTNGDPDNWKNRQNSDITSKDEKIGLPTTINIIKDDGA